MSGLSSWPKTSLPLDSKHVDICYKFVTEYIEDGIIKVIFVKSVDNDSDIMTKNLGSELHSKHAGKMISMKELLWQMEISVQVLTLGETPTYQMKEHCVQTLSWSRQKGRVSKSIFLRCFCLDHLKLEVVLQNCWISLMTDDVENLRKSEWVCYRTPHQQNESWSWKSSELPKDETSRYPRATGGSRFIFSSKLKLIIPFPNHSKVIAH